MKITADTNVLLRAIVGDDPLQARKAIKIMAQADAVAISAHVLCEMVWVLQRSYGVSRADIAKTIRQLLDTENVLINRPAAEAGLAVLDTGGDFADGVIAFEGSWLGGETFVSFDKSAVELLSKQGKSTLLL
jgi:predicted nucleic-acid-binding protein